MATKYVNVDRQTPMLLPPDLREWVAGNDLIHFIIEAVESSDLGSARVNVRGTGDAQYPPAMMLALLIYSYATGTMSSRGIEGSTYDSVTVRYLCDNHHPDHDTIARFRRENGPLLKSCFVRVLELARELGLLKLGMISVDGTKIAARAAKRRNLTEQQLVGEILRLEGQVEGLLAQAETEDSQDKDEGTTLPQELADRRERLERLRQAQKVLEERRQAKQRPKSGKNAVHPIEPDSAMMRTAQGPFIQGYNAQAAVTSEGTTLIVGTHVVSAVNDRQQLVATVQSIPQQVEKPETVLADTGYDNHDQIEELKKRGIAVYCPPQKVAAQPPEPHRGPKRLRIWQERQARKEELKRPQVKKRYGRRAVSSEPCFHLIKRLMGFSRFLLRGLAKVNLEWDWVALAYNCRKIVRAVA
jgi:transposase